MSGSDGGGSGAGSGCIESILSASAAVAVGEVGLYEENEAL